MGLTKKEIEICKETDDVLNLLVEVVKCIRKKQSYVSLMDELVTAVEGIGEIAKEVKHTKEFANTIGSKTGDFIEAFNSVENT